ncbi:MAG: lytic transglycosylase domain-containing protein [Prevotella sp.]|nr:lytic transglycosylase domain-containing protein [Prevotella sp.]
MLLAFLALMPLSMSAQEVTTVEEESDDEDEIIVTDQEGNEEVIEFPEAMTYDLDSLMNLYMSKTYLEEDADCHTSDVNPTYSRDEYIERLSRMPCIMEMAYNDVVQKFIDRYSGRLRHSISYMLGASNFYMPIFEEALEIYQLPLELKYLPIIESALNPKAVSRVGATGLWQFMLTTGKQYGLNVNSLVDERRDPQRASLAAARYLRDLYKIFGDWNLVIAAYNCGPENINKAIHRAQAANKDSVANVKDYWHIYPYLPKETRGYVPAFIAANYIMTYYSLHNICPMNTRLPAKSDTVMVHRNVHLEQVAEVVGINIDLLRSLNPMYRRDVVPGATAPSPLRLPQTEVGKFIDLEDSVYNYKASELLSNRLEVEVNDDVPTYYHKNKRSYKRGKKARYGKRSKYSRRRASASKRRSSASKKRKSTRRRRRR